MDTQLDPKLVRLTKAIGLAESDDGTGNPNYNAVGDAGTSHGAYQWQPNNFERAAQKANLDPNDFSGTNQDKVAYSQVKEMYERGFSPEQIAASWNAGEKKALDGSWQQNVGDTTISGQKIHFDTPSYVKKVNDYYDKLYDQEGVDGAQQQQPQGQDKQQAAPTDEEDVGLLPSGSLSLKHLSQNLSSRFQELGDAISTGSQGGTGIAHGLIQAGGAVAGGLGDVVGAGLEMIPGFQWTEKQVGKGMSSLLQTPEGQQLVGGWHDFAVQHPNAAKDIGAAANIASVLPMFKGLGMAKNVAGSAITVGRMAVSREAFEKEAIAEMQDRMIPTAQKTLGNAEKRGLYPMQNMVKNPELLPDIKDTPLGKEEYDSTDALKNLNVHSDATEDLLQDRFLKIEDQMRQQGIDPRFNIKDDSVLLNSVLKSEMEGSAQYNTAKGILDRALDSVKASSPDGKWTLSQANQVKRELASDINFRNLSFNERENVRGIFQKFVESRAATFGDNRIQEINRIAGNLAETRKVLEGIHGRQVKLPRGSLWQKLRQEGIADLLGSMGEAAGSSVGAPLIGGLGTRAAVKALIPKRAGAAAIKRIKEYQGMQLPKGIPSKTLLPATLRGIGQAQKPTAQISP